jgi:7-cyano-7-deazaguanine synthase
MSGNRPAVILLSGGLDSAVALAVCRRDGFEPFALTIDYGQRHRIELDCARDLAAALRVKRHIVLNVDLTRWGGSALTSAIDVPTRRGMDAMGRDIPVTYVPARNTIFLSLAMGWAETLKSGDIFIGAHSLDYSGYPDCRPEYFEAFARMAELATKTGVEGTHWQIHAPLLHMTKADIVRLGVSLGVPLEHTMSCYQPGTDADEVIACGICDACVIRRNAFAALGANDPLRYSSSRVQS